MYQIDFYISVEFTLQAFNQLYQRTSASTPHIQQLIRICTLAALHIISISCLCKYLLYYLCDNGFLNF